MSLFVCVFAVPDGPQFFRIKPRSFNTLYLEWDKPLEPNGVLIGYQLKYHTGELLSSCEEEDDLGIILIASQHISSSLSFFCECVCVCVCVVNGSREGRPKLETFPPNVTDFTFRLPDRSTRYKFFLSALTQVGAGEVFAEESPHFANEGEY